MSPTPSYQQSRELATAKQSHTQGGGSGHGCGVPQDQMLQQQEWATVGHRMQPQDLYSEVP